MPGKIDSPELVSFNVTLSGTEAYAFAQWLKRRQFDDLRKRAVDEEDALNMDRAADKIRDALREAGFFPR